MSKVRLSMDLPKVGDRLVRVMTVSSGRAYSTFEPQECVVTFVNNAHHWYQVKFKDTEIKESYSVPIIDHSIVHASNGTIPVYCVETGIAYSSVSQCAKDINILPSSISAQLKNDYSANHEYHFVYVL